MKQMKQMQKTTKYNFSIYVMVIIFAIVMQLMSALGMLSSLLEGLLVPMTAYMILAVSLNLVVGILGNLSLGHAGFMCVGAFSSAFFSKLAEGAMPDGLRFFLALLIGVIVAGIFGILIGIPVLRLRGDYLAIVTLAFGEIIKNVINAMYVGVDGSGFHFSLKDSVSLNLDSTGEVIVNGAQGINGTPHDSSFIIGILLLLLTLVIILNLINSRGGRAIMAIRDDRIAAESVGINITKYKMMAFAMSAAIAGAAGVLYAHNLSSLVASPKNFGYNMSIMILVYVVLGGIGNMRGSLIAAVVLTLIPELLRGLSNYRMLIYSIILIVVMIFNWSKGGREFKEKLAVKLRNVFRSKRKEAR